MLRETDVMPRVELYDHRGPNRTKDKRLAHPSAYSRSGGFRAVSAVYPLDTAGEGGIARYLRCVGRTRSCSEGGGTATGLDLARHRAPNLEWN